LSLAIARRLRPSVSVESSLKVCCNSMSLDTIHPLFLNLSERALDSRSIEQRPLPNSLFFYPIQGMRLQVAAWSSLINHSWFSLGLGWRIDVH
jgi:hypothetical protein